MSLTVPLTMAIVAMPLVAWFVFCGPNERPVVGPICAATFLFALMWTAISRRDRALPIFDVGAIFAFVMLLYTAVPQIGFMVGGLAFTVLSDSRMLQYNPTAYDVGAFGWRYVVYFAGFATAYLLFRRTADIAVIRMPGKATTIAIIWWALVLAAFLVSLWGATGFSFLRSYDDLEGQQSLFESLPLIVQQVSHNAYGILLILKYALLIVLYSSWPRRRWLIFCWIAAEVCITVATFGARTPLLHFLAANVMLYHIAVKPLSFGNAVGSVVVLTAGALIYGFLRNVVEADIGDAPLLSTTNEFQSVFATGYDVAQRYFSGSLPVPLQVYFADVLRLIPQQFLPFPKIEPSGWYLREIGFDGLGIGFMFGAIAVGVITGDWPSLAIHGFSLGWILAVVHNWYGRHNKNFYVTLSYLWTCLAVYYCIRASTLYITVWVGYRLLPALLLIYMSAKLIRLASVNIQTQLEQGRKLHPTQISSTGGSV